MALTSADSTIERQRRLNQVFSIAIYAGPTPLVLGPAADLINPVLTGSDVSDIDAEFVADPFLLFRDGLWHMFFEAMDRHTGRGVIALATSADARSWAYRQVVLQDPFHLSYPYVFEHGGQCYLIPETQRTGCVRLYRADPFPFRWKLVDVLLKRPLADSSVVHFQDRWWLFGSQDNSSLWVYHSSDLAGPWQEHPKNPVVVGRPDHARPAGRLTPWKAGLLRYAQDCATQYGVRVWPVQVTVLSQEDYAEEWVEAPVVGPGPEHWNRGGMHHVDPHMTAEGIWLASVDGWFAAQSTPAAER